MTSRPTIEDLRQRLEDSLRQSIHGHYFVPQAIVKEIFGYDRIKAAVNELTGEHDRRIRLAEKIQKDLSIVFAILISMDQPDSIIDFRSHDFNDKELPIKESRALEIIPQFGHRFARDYQWRFIPYFFREDMWEAHQDIVSPSRIIPFVREKEIGGGGFGRICLMTLPACCQNLFSSKSGDVSVVRKTIKRRHKQSDEDHYSVFSREIRVIRLLQLLKHPNIISLLGSYSHQDELHLLFPYHDMDLEEFMTLEVRPDGFQHDITFITALRDLASAVEHVHDLRLTDDSHGMDLKAIGYHFDLHPANILVKHGTFVLADFGLGSVKHEASQSDTPWKKGRGDYIAPECMHKSTFEPQVVGRGIDVWAFGCLVADMVTYVKRGPQGLQEFREVREQEVPDASFPWYFWKPGGQLKSSVSDWLTGLVETTSKSSNDLIMLALQTLVPDRNSRPDISRVRLGLDAAVLSILASTISANFTEYITTAAPRRRGSLKVMELWYEHERIRSLSQLFCRDEESTVKALLETKGFQTCYDVMTSSLRCIKSALAVTGAPKTGTQQIEDATGIEESFEAQIPTLAEALWKLLPSRLSKEAQMLFLQSIAQKSPNSDVDRLVAIEALLQSQEQFDAAAIAHMKHLRKDMNQSNTKQFLRRRDLLTSPELQDGHMYGLYETTERHERVLVEWMYYRESWKKVSNVERLLIMGLRAKGFSSDRKPNALRILKCLGFVEQEDLDAEEHGYGFIYQLPSRFSDSQSKRVPLTLQEVLHFSRKSRTQIPLRAKFLLARSLAGFLRDFHAVGYLHKTINSKNIMFTHNTEDPNQQYPGDMFKSIEPWGNPLIVGLQRCRPEGEIWETEGPPDKDGMEGYEHPEYREHGRFKMVYDYYSLGLVLLEVGLWHPVLKDYYGDPDQRKKLSASGFRKQYMVKYAPRLTFTVGEVYRDVVLACLDGSLASSTSTDGEVFGRFYQTVMRPLDNLAELRI